MVEYEYLVKGTVQAGILNPWPVNNEGVFEKLTDELNKLSTEGWKLIAVIPSGNNDREICYLRREKK